MASPHIEHVIVLMLENRSFDHMFGFLNHPHLPNLDPTRHTNTAPGVGTVAGGVVHAVAYGLIFDALGRSLVSTLQRHGELLPDVAAREFEEGISEHIEAGVRRVAEMALEERPSGS